MEDIIDNTLSWTHVETYINFDVMVTACMRREMDLESWCPLFWAIILLHSQDRQDIKAPRCNEAENLEGILISLGNVSGIKDCTLYRELL
jgi:hypothetical protein